MPRSSLSLLPSAVLHNAAASLRVLQLLNIKIRASTVVGVYMPSLDTLLVDNCGGSAVRLLCIQHCGSLTFRDAILCAYS